MKVWLAFVATDINEDNFLQIYDIKYLLYALEGSVPSDDRIVYEMEQLDNDKSGFVSCQEWLQYLCIDKSESMEKFVYKDELRQKFIAFDKDKSGFLCFNELEVLIKEELNESTECYEKYSGVDHTVYNNMIK